MIQRKYWKDKKLSDWQNYASQEEGSYPVYDAKAKKAVKLVNRWRRAQELMLKAEKLRKLANELEFQADELKKNHENSSPDSQ